VSAGPIAVFLLHPFGDSCISVESGAQSSFGSDSLPSTAGKRINRESMSTSIKMPVAARSLDQWPSQTWAEIVSLAPAGDEEDRAVLLRLLEIGFLPGEPMRVIARGLPGGDPMAVRVGRTTFALRRHEAAMIRVQATASSTGSARWTPPPWSRSRCASRCWAIPIAARPRCSTC